MSDATVVSSAPTLGVGEHQSETMTTDGRLRVESVAAAGSALIGKVGIDQTTPGTTNGVANDSVLDGALASGSVTSATTIATLPLAGFAGAHLVLTGIGSGNTVVVEQTLDGTNWVATNGVVVNPAGVSSQYITNPVAAAGANVPIWYPATGISIRARVSTYGSGTVAATFLGKRIAPSPAGAPIFVANNTSNPAQVSSVRLPTTTAGYGIVPVVTAALASNKVIKASAGNLYGLNLGSTTVAGYFLLFDAVSLPGDGAVTPKKQWAVTAGQSLELRFDPPLRLGTGITVGFSSNTTTPFTLAASATAFIDGEAV